MIAAYFNITGIAEWCCFIASLFLLDKKTTYWRLFQLFLILTICCRNYWLVYELYYPPTDKCVTIQYSNAYPDRFFYLVIYPGTGNAKDKDQTPIFDLIVCLSWFGKFFLFQKFWKYNSYTQLLGDILVAGISVYFLFSVFKAPEYKNLFGYEYFWLANGLHSFIHGKYAALLFWRFSLCLL